MTTYLRALALATALAISLTCQAQEPDTFQAQLRLCEAITGGDADAVAAALDAGADPSHICSNETIPPLHLAIVSGKVEIAKLLIHRGADVNGPDDGLSSTPLHYAVEKEPSLVALLLDRGAKVNTLRDDGLSPLGLAALSHDNPAIAQALIDAGADVNAVDEQGDSILDMAVAAGHRKVAAALEAAGAAPGGEPGMPVESGTDNAEDVQTTDSTTNAKRTTEGKLLFKGLWPGMPVQQAAARLKELGIPAGKSVSIGRTRRDGQDVDIMEFRETTAIDGSGFIERVEDERWTIWYDQQTGTVTRFMFRWSSVAPLFNCGDMEVRQFAQTFMDAYGLPSLEPVLTHNWGFEYADPAGWKVRIEEDRTLLVDAVAAASQRTFD